MTKSTLAGLLSFCFPFLALAHGEDKLGPNGGYIRMPGAMHTELVPSSSNSLKVYLLDIHWKNPVVRDSSVALVHKNSKRTKAKCAPKVDHFICDFGKAVDLRKHGEIHVEVKRERQRGVAVSYALPFSLGDSSNHHQKE